jgi:hypothetical protein
MKFRKGSNSANQADFGVVGSVAQSGPFTAGEMPATDVGLFGKFVTPGHQRSMKHNI